MYKLIVALVCGTVVSQIVISSNTAMAIDFPSQFWQLDKGKETVVESSGSSDPSPRRGDSRRHHSPARRSTP